MKKPIHLYILVTLSVIQSLLRGYSAFFAKYDEESARQMFQNLNVTGLDETIFDYLKESFLFQTNIINEGLVVVLLFAVMATIVLLFLQRKEQA